MRCRGGIVKHCGERGTRLIGALRDGVVKQGGEWETRLMKNIYNIIIFCYIVLYGYFYFRIGII